VHTTHPNVENILQNHKIYQMMTNENKIHKMTTTYTKLLQNIPNDYKMYQITTNASNIHYVNISKISIQGLSKN
jgi:hypothetical protein